MLDLFNIGQFFKVNTHIVKAVVCANVDFSLR